jgi:hypothetical protein
MSVSLTTNRVAYTGDGTTTAFPFSYSVYATSEIEVRRVVTATEVETLMVLGTDYTVALTSTAPSAGTVTMTTAPTTLQKLVIRAILPQTQLISLVDNESVPADTWEEGFDRAVKLIQQLQEQLNRVVIQGVLKTTPLTLPLPVANKLLGWNAAGTALENKDP